MNASSALRRKKAAKRIVASAACLALAGSLAPISQAIAAPKTLEEYNVSIEQASSRLDSLNTQLEVASEDLHAINQKVSKLKKKLKKTRKSMKKTKADLGTAREQLSATVIETYRNGNVSYLSVLLRATTFSEFTSKLYLLDRVAANRANAIEQVNSLQGKLEKEEKTIEKSLKEQESLKSQAISKRASIESSISSTEHLLDSLDEEMIAAVNEQSEKAAKAAAEAQTEVEQADDAKSEEQTDQPAQSKPKKKSANTTQSTPKQDTSTSTSKPKKDTSSQEAEQPEQDSADVGSTSTAGAHGSVVGIADAQLGVKYTWGGESPKSGFDCSGLVMYCYAKIGISLSHSAASQFYEGTRIAKSALMPGDLVFFGPSIAGIHHVGIYAGGGSYIHAPRTGDVVKYSDLSSRSDFVGACRP